LDAAKSTIGEALRAELARQALIRKKELFETIVKRISEIELIKDYGGYITQVICPVETPRKAVSPILAMTLGAGGLLGLFLGVGLAYVADLRDRTFRGPGEVEQTLELPLLAEVPPMGRTTRQFARSENGAASGIDPGVVAHHQPASQDAEAIRGLRTAFCFITRRGGQKVIQITSPSAADGKTTLAANLAVSLAQSGRTVLLVDADFRSPAVHWLFGVDFSLGLSSIISDQAELTDAIQGVGIENLSILPAGPLPANPADLLTSVRFEQFLAVAREQYDYVIIDSPPLLAISDASVIAARADGVLLTLRITRNGAPAAAQAARMLTAMDAQTLGVVVNGYRKERNYRAGSGLGSTYPAGYGSDNGNGNGQAPHEETKRKIRRDTIAQRST
jgi:polysaccharide biosynthesis transport protein